MALLRVSSRAESVETEGVRRRPADLPLAPYPADRVVREPWGARCQGDPCAERRALPGGAPLTCENAIPVVGTATVTTVDGTTLGSLVATARTIVSPPGSFRWDPRVIRRKGNPVDTWLIVVLILAALVVLALLTFAVATRRKVVKRRRR